MEDEIWKPVPEDEYSELYEISNYGRIRSFHTGAPVILNPTPVKSGHLYINLKKNGGRKNCSISRMVCYAFNGPPGPERKYACHIDDDPQNNFYKNIYWGDQKDNMDDCRRNGNSPIGERHGMNQLSREEVIDIREYDGDKTQKELAKEYDVCQQTISMIKTNKIWKHLN